MALDNGRNVTDISSKQDVNYTYFCVATARYTLIDHCLSTSLDIAFDFATTCGKM